jgi:hypothetical protein
MRAGIFLFTFILQILSYNSETIFNISIDYMRCPISVIAKQNSLKLKLGPYYVENIIYGSDGNIQYLAFHYGKGAAGEVELLYFDPFNKEGKQLIKEVRTFIHFIGDSFDEEMGYTSKLIYPNDISESHLWKKYDELIGKKTNVEMVVEVAECKRKSKFIDQENLRKYQPDELVFLG